MQPCPRRLIAGQPQHTLQTQGAGPILLTRHVPQPPCSPDIGDSEIHPAIARRPGKPGKHLLSRSVSRTLEWCEGNPPFLKSISWGRLSQGDIQLWRFDFERNEYFRNTKDSGG